MKAATLAVSALAGLALASCGGGGGGDTGSTSTSDAAQITAAIQLEGTSTSASVCKQVLSQAGIDRLGGMKACASAVKGNDARSESVSAVKVAGTTAVAQAKVHGGHNDGCVYGFSLVKEDGRWKVDTQRAISPQAVCLQ